MVNKWLTDYQNCDLYVHFLCELCQQAYIVNSTRMRVFVDDARPANSLKRIYLYFMQFHLIFFIHSTRDIRVHVCMFEYDFKN